MHDNPKYMKFKARHISQQLTITSDLMSTSLYNTPGHDHYVHLDW